MMINQLPATGSVVGTDEFALDKSGTTYKGKINDIVALGPQPTSATPLMDGTAAVGTSDDYARADHVHPTDTGIIALIPAASNATPQALGTAAAGSSGDYSRADHVHPKLTLYNKLFTATTDVTGNAVLGVDFNNRLIVNVQTSNSLIIWQLGVASGSTQKMLHFSSYTGAALASTAVTFRVYWLDPTEFASSEVT